jgi:hypothetical protein
MNAVQNMLRNFEQIDKPQPKVDYVPCKEDYCLMIDGKFEGSIYHYSTIVDMMFDGFRLKPNEKFVRMTELTVEELLQLLEIRKQAQK